ncbi:MULTISPECIES: GNAT family N-acetyltransferase [unclassified Azospirillum]|uniref:GNAT family N-acetyltransferase n=1 Tax=unclassified Azospirillum TaxID=2630922 RepID=UPI000B64FAA3|nr:MULTISPECIES: GNAT family N-acetyltransferase [unclassified Azospirillum]SNS38025.1 Acetyltransferase (GNAT) family protein [Azospirillum sp. RU38E]SNS56632.1 Acetyltransferase (GNAT) family protein [Azospirillum sp. RU37A]
MTRIVRLAPGDEGRLDAYLAGHPATSLFLRSNLRRAGLVDEGQRFQGRYAAALTAEDDIAGVIAHSWNGNMLIQAPPVLAVELARHLMAEGDRLLCGLIGPLEAASAVADAFPEQSFRRGGAEDLFDLPLDRLVVPPLLSSGTCRCRRATAQDIPLLAGWRVDYSVEALDAVPDAALRAQAEADIAVWVSAGDVFLLTGADGAILSMATHNARIPDTVQIGGVWTPRDSRGRGYARAVVAGALLAAREDGARLAVLFTGKENEPARRAYLALGFQIIGDYAILLC